MDVRYAPTTDGARIGYAVVGSGRSTVVLVPAVRASIEPLLGEPAMIHLLAGLTAGRRLVVMDARGTTAPSCPDGSEHGGPGAPTSSPAVLRR